MTEPGEPHIRELFDLSGKTALISGASGFLGSALARALAEAGARVVVTSRDCQTAADCAQSLPDPDQLGHVGLAMNQLDESSIDRAFHAAVEETGRLDILVNNGHAAQGADWSQVTMAKFTQQLSNAAGYFHLARLVRDHAVAQSHSASIVLLGSMYGVVGSYPDAYQDICAASPVAYHALKGGIVQMTRHLAVYWAADQVRVNSLSPGPFPNSEKVPAGLVERLNSHSPMRRMGRPHELKGALVFLASEASSYMTGQNLVIDGGWTAW